MNDVAIALIGFGGTFACLGLAYWVFQRGRAPAPMSETAPPAEHPTAVIAPDQLFGLAHTQNTAEPATEFLSREEVLAAAARRASGPAAEPATEFLSREEIFGRVESTGTSEPGTEVIPQAEILAAASRRAATDD